MSFEPVLWAMRSAPVKDAAEWSVLVAMAEASEEDGEACYRSRPTIAAMVKVDPKTVGRKQIELERRGLIARGDQSRVAHYPADKRPVVWDLLIPFDWFPDIEKTNQLRVAKGRRPLIAEDRPAIVDKAERKPRKDLGQPRPERRKNSGGTQSPVDSGGTQSPPGTQSPVAGGLEVPERGDSESYNSVLVTHSLNPEQISPDADAIGDESEPPSLGGELFLVPSGEVEDLFDVFYDQAYPRKIDRRDARKAWNAAMNLKVDPNRIIEAARTYAREVAGKDREYIKYPAKWLRAGSYENTQPQHRPDPAPTAPRNGHGPHCGECDPHSRVLYPEGRGSSVAVACPKCHRVSIRKAAASE